MRVGIGRSEIIKTPRFSHIRKANPLDEDRPDAAGDPTQRHRMIRRGALFGPPLAAGAVQDDGAQRGLHFICVVADVARQFEFVQSNWLNNPNFPNGGAPGAPGGPYTPPVAGTLADGPDPIVGEHDAGAEVAPPAKRRASVRDTGAVRADDRRRVLLPSIRQPACSTGGGCDRVDFSGGRRSNYAACGDLSSGRRTQHPWRCRSGPIGWPEG